MEYGQRQQSALLARILQQMQQTSQFQPQSYGALAAGLGTAFLEKKAYDKEIERGRKEQADQAKALAEALGRFGSRNTEMAPQQLPPGSIPIAGGDQWPGVEADPQLAQAGLLQELSQIQDPMAQALMGRVLEQQLQPQRQNLVASEDESGIQRLVPEAPGVITGRPQEKTPDFVTLLSPKGEQRSFSKSDERIGNLMEKGWTVRNQPLVQIGDTGPQFPSPPQGFFRPDQKQPGLVPEPGSPPPAERQMSGETKAKMGLLESSKKSLEEAQGILFTERGYRNDLVAEMLNPFRTGDAADLYNSMREAMSNRLRAESGATITAEEVEDQLQRFTPKVWDSKDVAMNKFQRFRRFIDTYQEAITFQPDDEKKEDKAVIRFDREGNRR